MSMTKKFKALLGRGQPPAGRATPEKRSREATTDKVVKQIKELNKEIEDLGDVVDEIGDFVHGALSLMHEVREEMAGVKRTIPQMQDLVAFQAACNTAGISRKFGGRVDVDYDILLDTLGHEGEAEMRRTIDMRESERASKASNRPPPKKAKPTGRGKIRKGA